MRPACCNRPYRPIASLNTSRPRSSRPRTGAFQLINSTRSAMPTPFLLRPSTGTGPVAPTLSTFTRPGTGDVAVVSRAEAPGKLARLGDPDPRAHENLRLEPARLARANADRPVVEVTAVL